IGLLGTVEHGSTARYRQRDGLLPPRPPTPAHSPAPFAFTGAGNRAALYVLATRRQRPPAVPQVQDRAGSDTPSQFPQELVNPRARGASPGRIQQSTQPADVALALCTALCARSRLSPLARLSPRYLRHLIKDFLAAGWSGADILY